MSPCSEKRRSLAREVMSLADSAEKIASDVSYEGTEQEVELLLGIASDLRATARKAAGSDGPMVGLVH